MNKKYFIKTLCLLLVVSNISQSAFLAGVPSQLPEPDQKKTTEGKVAISIMSYLRNTHLRHRAIYLGSHPDYRGKEVPPNGHISIMIEEAKLSLDILNYMSKEESVQ